MNHEYNDPVQLIPIAEINVVNTRLRNKRKFEEIVASIKVLGLKKPITVTPASGKYGDGCFDLVCGEGRLLAFQGLGETHIPARIQNITTENLLLMSLVENLARRQNDCAELLEEIRAMQERGMTVPQIAKKTNLTTSYIRGILRLLKNGEKELILAVVRRLVPLNVAIDIAKVGEGDLQKVLCEAYQDEELRGAKLLKVRRFIDRRRERLQRKSGKRKARDMSSQKILLAYRDESTRQQVVVKQAQLCQRQLIYVVSALKRLCKDENFINLLRAEKLESMPTFLSDKIL